MYSIGQLCREFHFSRSTLLYYDSIGLMPASSRTQGNYRQYSEADRQRLMQICTFREAGVKLSQIKDLLASGGETERAVLENRLQELNLEIRQLKSRQKLIVEMLKDKNLAQDQMPLDRKAFVSILRSCGLEEEAMSKLHMQFEKNTPDSHQAFLEFLGISEDEIQKIRLHSGRT